MKGFIVITPASAINIFNLIHEGESKYAYAYGLNIEDKQIVNHLEICKHMDVYNVLEKISNDGSGLIWDAIAVTTQGWAAPLDLNLDEELNVPPSKHPKKTRVMLMCIVTKDRIIHSVIKLENEEPQYQADGKGALSEALLNIYPKEKLSYENNNQFYV